MAFTASDVTKLEAAIANGIQQVTYADGRSVRYQNVDQMLAALKLMRGDVAAAGSAGTSRRRTTIVRVGRCR